MYCIYFIHVDVLLFKSFEQAKRGIKFRSYWLIHKPGIGCFLRNVLKLFF